MRYELTLSGRCGADSEEDAQAMVQALTDAFKIAGVQFNLDIWDGKQNRAVELDRWLGRLPAELRRDARMHADCAMNDAVLASRNAGFGRALALAQLAEKIERQD